MSDLRYASWRFRIWNDARELSYDQIDRLVADGSVKPGADADEVLLAHRRSLQSKRPATRPTEAT